LSPSIQRKTESKKIELDMIEKMKTSKESTISVIKLDDIIRKSTNDYKSKIVGDSLWIFGP